MKGKIYKYTNKKNGKIYIGQTVRPIKTRDKRHQNDAKYNSELYFHRALRKYGRCNFSLEIIEDNIELDKLDEREKYWIKYYDSFYLNGKGYNMTEGGQWGNAPRKLSDDEIEEIQFILVSDDSISITDIAKEFDVSVSCVSDINRGKTWKNEKYKYPLRDNLSSLRYLTIEKYNGILEDLINTNLSQPEISKKHNIVSSIVSEINTGTINLSNKKITFPIRQGRYISNFDNLKQQTYEIINDYIVNEITTREISVKYNLSKSAIKAIICGRNRKNLTEKFIFPLKDNIEKNIEILSSFL